MLKLLHATMQKETDTEQKRLFPIIPESKKRVWQYIAFLRAYLVTTLKALVPSWFVYYVVLVVMYFKGFFIS